MPQFGFVPFAESFADTKWRGLKEISDVCLVACVGQPARQLACIARVSCSDGGRHDKNAKNPCTAPHTPHSN